jgi:ATP-binding cassette subfamily B protein
MQTGPNDCGIACLESILNYIGKEISGTHQLRIYQLKVTGISLLALKNLSCEYGLNGSCVEMEVSFLRSLITPCILHVVKAENAGHFIVFYGTRKFQGGTEYLIGDPSEGIGYVSEAQLQAIWKSRAALYFKEIKPGVKSHNLLYNISRLDKVVALPLMLIIPVLGILMVIIGIASSLFIQKCFDLTGKAIGQQQLMTSLALFLMIILFRTLLGYLRQHLLINFMLAIGQHYMFRYLNKIWASVNITKIDESFRQVMKIQSAFNSLLTGLATDGFLLMMIIGSLFFYFPVAAFFNLVYLVCVVLICKKVIPKLTAASHDNEKKLYQTVNMINSDLSNVNAHYEYATKAHYLQKHQNYYLIYEKITRKNANALNRINSIIQIVGNIQVILVLAISIHVLINGSKQGMLFLSINILTIFVTILVPRLVQAFQTFLDGIGAFAYIK